jgi:DNA primase
VLPSFFISPARQGYYCFGCGEKGDIFTFVEKMEGLDFREALKFLADKAGIELSNSKSESKSEKDLILAVLEEATLFFENKLSEHPQAKNYLSSRGLSEETCKSWRLGYAPADWRSLQGYLKARGTSDELMLKAGLIKRKDDSFSEPYDVFRDRLIFPLSDANGEVIAFSGRALAKETEPKYLNSPDTLLFTKSEVLYGLDKAKDQVRKKDYTVLVEGQMDLVLSHQAGVLNTVASSGTAFTASHLERLKRFSKRIILAFDGDAAGEKAAERSIELGLALGLEVKVALLPEGEDPAEIIKADPEKWRTILRKSVLSIEYLLNKIESKEKDQRKIGKAIESKILPLLKMIPSSIERSYFISLLSKRTGLDEKILLEDLNRVKLPEVGGSNLSDEDQELSSKERGVERKSRREAIEERLAEIAIWKNDLTEEFPEMIMLKSEEVELIDHLSKDILKNSLNTLRIDLAKAESARDQSRVDELTVEVQKVISEIRSLEERRKKL